MQSALKRHGGKHYLAHRILSLFPLRGSYLHYVEPYFGSGAVLFANDPEGVSEVVCDLDQNLTNFWRVLQHHSLFTSFVRTCQATPFSENEWLRAQEGLGIYTDAVGRAWAFFVHSRMSLAARGKVFAPLSRNRVRRGMNEQASAWLTAVEGLPAVHERLKRVVILNSREATKVIAQQDGPKTLFYLDPPYMADTRTSPKVYQHEMTAEQHKILLDLIVRCQGKVLLSGYHNDLYDKTLRSWHCTDFEEPNHAAGGAEKRKMVEAVWTNYAPKQNV